MNKNIRAIICIFFIIFAAMILYFSNYLFFKKDDYISSAHNKRLSSYSEHVTRGNILSNDGQLIAQTVIDEFGEEKRVYPFGNLFAHSVGHVDKGYTGIEAIGNFYMVSSHEGIFNKLADDVRGQKRTGDNIVTTLDVKLQQAAYDALGDYKGACVVLEPDTGRILAMVSKPDFNPNTIADDWEAINSVQGNDCLLNKATRGLYAPGSTFKVLTTLEYLREHPDNYESYLYNCTGENQILHNYSIHCYGGLVHGVLDLEHSLAQSCNCSFSNIGISLNREKYAALCSDFLFNKNIPGSYGCVESRFGLSADDSDAVLAQTAIGQGETVITPMHNALIAATIANGGVMMTPYVIDRVENFKGKTVTNFLPKMYGKLMTADEAAKIKEMMKLVVNEGTGSKLISDKHQVAAKTGSAQFSSDVEDTHAWIIAFAPADDPKIAVSVIIEHGGSGGETAAPVAKKIFDTYFDEILNE